MVVSGSPSGVSPAPRPMEKQATTAISTFAFCTTGRALTISTRMIAARIAEMMLEMRPSTTMRKKTIAFKEKRPIMLAIAASILWWNQ